MSNGSKVRGRAGKPRKGIGVLLQHAQECLPGYEDLHKALACNNIQRALELLDRLRAVGTNTELYLPKERNGVQAPPLLTKKDKLLARVVQANIATGLFVQLQSRNMA